MILLFLFSSSLTFLFEDNIIYVIADDIEAITTIVIKTIIINLGHVYSIFLD